MPPTTIRTAKGTARLTKCTTAGAAQKQALAQTAGLSGASGGNEYGTSIYIDGNGNYYIVDPFTQNSQIQVEFTGTENQINGLALVGIVHDHWGYLDGSSGVFTPYDVGNWQVNSIDNEPPATNNHFSPGDEQSAEYYGVPVFVTLGTVQYSFMWNPPPKNPDGTFNTQAHDSPLNQINPSYRC